MPLRRRRAQYHQLTTGERDRIIELHELGLSLRTIATRVGHNVSTIQRCVTRWIQEGLRARRRGSGAHRCTSERTDRRIRQSTIRDPFSTARAIRSRLPPGAGGSVSTQTIRNRLHEVQLRARVPATGVPLTALHRARRLAQCHRHRTWTIQWHRVLFTDESRFCLWRNDGRRRVWRRPGERYEPAHFAERHTGPTPGIMVWGGIMFDRRTPLVHIDGSLTADRYVTQVVEPVVLPLLQGAPNTVFQQDNARPHVARRTLNSLTGFDILPWPAASPDLNPIEHLWDLIGRDMNLGPLAQTIDDLRTAVDVAWQRLPQATINEVIDSMPRRIEACIAARGGHIRY